VSYTTVHSFTVTTQLGTSDDRVQLVPSVVSEHSNFIFNTLSDVVLPQKLSQKESEVFIFVQISVFSHISVAESVSTETFQSTLIG